MRIILLLLCSLFTAEILAAEKTIHLTVDYKTVSFGGKVRKAIVINQQIPAPTLHFKENDLVTIYVHNALNQETAIHWHGILVPWQMDGVLGISQKGIPPGKTFKYQFTLKQSGTYWYHAHAGLQEQEGLYGAFLIDPLKSPAYSYTKDYPIVLSDWSNTRADWILANLKREGDYYAPRFPLQPSLTKFLHDYKKASKQEKKNLIDDYLSMQKTRMNIYDLSDVAYDTFLLNGHSKESPWKALVKKGDTVRLRFIGASGSTIFNIKIPHHQMQMIHIEGNDVKPYIVDNFSIAPGETYDVLVNITKDTPCIIYAESRDTISAAIGALVTHPQQSVDIKQVSPFPEPISATREMMNMMMEEKNKGYLPVAKREDSDKPMSLNKHKMQIAPMNHMSHAPHQMKMNHKEHAKMTIKSHEMTLMSHHSMSMSSQNNMKMAHDMNMSMPLEPSIIGDSFSPSTRFYETSKSTKYQRIRAAVKTNDAHKPVSKVINMELYGYMDRFIWFINGVPEYNAHPISLEPGKRYRFIFTNNSMMHHPMHIHGHWFILRMGHDEYDPLLHTIDVPPGATITADVDTDASGQWFFHCHMLYHMTTGMSRVFQYSTLIDIVQEKAKPEDIIEATKYENRPIVRVDDLKSLDISLVNHPMAHAAGFWLANFLDIGGDPFHHAARLTFKGLYGPDYHKLELFSNDAEVYKGELENADLDIFYWHLISQFWAVKGGVNYFHTPAFRPYWQAGIGLEGVMPFFIDTNARVYFYGGSVKFDVELSRDTQLTNNFLIRTGIRSILATQTVTNAAIGSGLNQMRYIVRPYYRLMPGLTAFVEYENEQDYGTFKSLESILGEQTTQNTITFGLTILF